MAIKIYPKWVLQVLTETQDSDKFERFAADFWTAVSGRRFVVTSKNYDDGADGRAVEFSGQSVICATLRDDASKPISDAKTIIAKRGCPKEILFVYAKPMTEANIRSIHADLHDRVKLNCKMDSISATQIVDFISREIGVDEFLRHYGAEYDAIRIALQGHIDLSPASLRLAFTVLTIDETAVLRTTLMQRAVLLSISKHPEKSLEHLHSVFKSEHGLHHVSVASIEYHLQRAVTDGMIKPGAVGYVLTEGGLKENKVLCEQQLNSYVNGKELVRAGITSELGSALPEREWEKLWDKLESLFTNLFHREGIRLTKVLKDLVESGSTIDVEGNPVSVIQELAIEAANVWSGPSRDRIRCALINIFSPKNTEVYEWLLRLGAAYVAFCTLGLEQTVSQTLRKTLSDTEFYFDTDILLSYFCAHEEGNRSAVAIKKFSGDCGHKIGVPFPVVIESVRHANRAIIDSKIAGISPSEKLTPRQIIELFGTVFGREFQYLKSEGKTEPNSWIEYISDYTIAGRREGYGEADTEVFEALLDQCEFNVMPKLDSTDDALVVQVESVLEEKAKRIKHPVMNDPDRAGKFKIDSELLVSIHNHMQSRGSSSFAKNILITSASVLRISRDSLKSVATPLPQIMGLAEVMWLFSMLPDTAVSVKDLGMYLYEGNFSSTLQGLEKLIYQVINKAESFKVPPADRERLIHRLKQGMVSKAKQYGAARDVLREASYNPSLFASLAAATIDAESDIVHDPKVKMEIKHRLDELAKQIKQHND